MSLPPYGYDDESVIARKRLLQLLDQESFDADSLRAAADELGRDCRHQIDELLKYSDSNDLESFEVTKASLKQMLELQPKI